MLQMKVNKKLLHGMRIFMHLSMSNSTPPRHIGGDLYNLLFKGHTPRAIIFFSRCTQYPGAMWKFVYMYIMLFEFHYNYKIPTSGEYISNIRHTNPHAPMRGRGEWGLTLIGALFIIK